jgi:alkanesulfonate monooxygenase SsuD/methylene tetrahydromethanopterin reductase-like flavin-dependent oxidoreductase (luciferase family)
MKFGIFYEHQLPRPWDADSERQLLHDALDQIELADKLGFHAVWEVEHHFLEEYSHSSAPEVFLAAASQRTKSIRLGHGIIQTAPYYNHPARTAERVATLDLLSNGRVELGTGESATLTEMGGFNISPDDKRDQWREGLDVMLRCMTEEPFGGHEGKYVSMPKRNVVPKPLQKPHPPLWLACSRRETIHFAAQLGLGALTFAFIDPEEAATWVNDYYDTMANEGVPVGQSVNPNVACVTTFMCMPTEERAIAAGVEGANFFGYSLLHYVIEGAHEGGGEPLWDRYLQFREATGFSFEAAGQSVGELSAKSGDEDAAGLRGAVGTPKQIAEFLRRYEEVGVDQVIFVSQAGKNRHEDIMESLELFGTQVLPEFAERDAQREAEKAKRMEPIIEKALARKGG